MKGIDKSKISLRTKINLLSLGVVILSIFISSLFTTRVVEGNIKREVENNVLNIARAVAVVPEVIDAFKEDEPSLTIQPIAEAIRTATKDIEFIVVTNLEGIRYSHPNPQRIGARFVGGDEGPALAEGKEYVSTAMGTLGLSTRALTPIFDQGGNRIGMVAVGVLNRNIVKLQNQIRNRVYAAALLGIFIGFLGSVYLARNIKDTLMGLEPDEISKLFQERNAILEAVKEGIVAVDSTGSITLVNQAAREQLELQEEEVLGKPIEEVVPDTKLRRVLETGIPEYDQQQRVKGTEIMVNRVPVKDRDKTIGVIASFRTKTELTILAEELTGVKMMVNSLRANTHEFMNKMHVILGLIQLQEYDKAEEYIMDISKSQQEIISFVVNKIKDPAVAALLLGKHTAGRELDIKVNICPSSHLERLKGRITSSAMITIIGNLIENSFDALRYQQGMKAVQVCIREGKNHVLISVKDNGPGINIVDSEKIFTRGFTTKENGRGIGLYLVKQNLEGLGGKLRLMGKDGAHFVIRIPKN